MNTIRVCTITLDGKLYEREIPSFRGAVMGIAGNNPLFHNHSDEGDIHRYPRVQYKVIDGRPAVIGFEDGADALCSLFLPASKHVMKIGRIYREFVVANVVKDSFLFPLRQGEMRRYTLHSWLPLNADNYAAFMRMSSLSERIAKLDEILTGNILSLYKGFQVYVEDHITAHIVDMVPLLVTFKGVKMTAFDAVIETDFALPEHCGIGKGVSHGFGVVCLHRN